MARRSLWAIGALALPIIGLASAPHASAAATWTLSPNGSKLVVNVGGGTAIAPRCIANIVWIDAGLATTAYCDLLTNFTINGSTAVDTFTLTGLVPSDYPRLPKLYVNTKAGDDLVIGGPLNEIISAGAGNDQIRAGAGNDQVQGGAGNDTVLGEAGVDILNGDGGDDRLEGCIGLVTCIDDGRNTLQGGTGNDRIIGGPNNDLLNGNDGNDRLQGGPGDDEVLGGNGDDMIDGDGFDLRVGLDRLGGGAGSDTIIGNNLDDAGDTSPDVDHFRWKITFEASPFNIEGIITGQAEDDIDVEVLNPGTWSLSTQAAGTGLALRQVRTDPLFKWRLNINAVDRITMRMSIGDDKLYVVPSPTMVATALGGPGIDRLSIPVDGDISQAVDTGSTVTTPGNLPVAYAGFESVTLWNLNGPGDGPMP